MVSDVTLISPHTKQAANNYLLSPLKSSSSSIEEYDIKDIEKGALRSGGIPKLFSKEYFGLVVNYAAIGFIYGGLPSTIFPFYLNYLNLEGYQVIGVATMITLPWSYKTFFGIFIDSFPILGYRRKPYMVIGWLFCFTMLVLMAFLPIPKPYFFPSIPKNNRNASDTSQILNPLSSSQAFPYVLLMTFAAVGYILTDVASDGMVVELAQREPQLVRGHTQTNIYLTRTIFSALSHLIIAFGMNGQEYGGSFNFYIPISVFAHLFAFGALLAALSSFFFIQDVRVSVRSFRRNCEEMWKICQKRVVWQILIFQFTNAFLYSISTTAAQPVESYWAKVVPLTRGIFTVLGSFTFACALWFTKKYLLNSNWRLGILYTTFLMNGLDAIVSMLTIYDVIRNPCFWLGVPLIEHIPEGVRFIIGTYVVVEIAQPGYEAATYSLVTTISNLAGPCAAVVTNLIDRNFDVSNKDIMKDSMHVRNQVAWTFIICYSFSIFSNITLFLLPQQKPQTQKLLKYGGTNKFMGAFCLIGAFLALIWSTLFNIMSILPSTSCLVIVGGQGCSTSNKT